MTNDLAPDVVRAAPVAWTIDSSLDVLRGDLDEHGLQCAYELEQRVPDGVELQIAGLVHDVAHRVTTEAAKVEGRDVPWLDHWEAILRRVALAR